MRNFAELANKLHADLPYASQPFITSDMAISTVRAFSLKNSFLKKFEDDKGPQADSACLELFLLCNERCRDFSFKPQKLFQEEVIGEVKHILDDIFFRGPDLAFGSSDLDDLIAVGPGASIGARSYNFYSKLFDSPLTYTDDRLPTYYRRAIRSNPTWFSAEKRREAEFGFRKVVGNSLSFVPKTTNISRSICTEPSLNMLFQKGLGSIFEQLLQRHFRIDLSKQPEINRRLARLGSIDSSFGTIDLKSASDSISLALLREILPPYVMRLVETFRSPSVTLPGGRVQELYMVSSMGNGFTFPLQTLLFASVVRACYRVLGITPEYLNGEPANFGVFGDDIIVRKDAYAFVVEALELFGFTVNKDKSFNVGSFRESCGGDYYRGSDVRGVYLKHFSHETDVYSIFNRLVRWCAVSGVPLVSTVNWLSGQCRFLPVPYHAGDTEGIKVPFAALRTFKSDENGSIYYSALVPLTTSFKAPMSEDEVLRYPSKKKQKIGFNPDGIVVAYVGSYIRNSRITLRTEEGPHRFKVRRRKTPHWDYYNTAALKEQVHDWEVMYDLLGCYSAVDAAKKI